MTPAIFAGGQAYTVQGQCAIPHPDCQGVEHINPQLTKLHQLAMQHATLLAGHSVGTLSPQGSLCITALATLAATKSLRPGTAATALASVTTTTTEMNIPNDLIVCVIGKEWAKSMKLGNSQGQPSKFQTQKKDPKIGELQFRELHRLSFSPNTSLIPAA